MRLVARVSAQRNHHAEVERASKVTQPFVSTVAAELTEALSRQRRTVKVGFTGSRHEPTVEQKRFIRRNLYDATELHHGCCVGSDYAAHTCAVALTTQPSIWLHPPTNEKLMVPLSSLLTRGDIHALSPKPYHDRNRDIVDACDILIATPNGPRRPHSGTWYTIDYATRRNVPVVVCLPNGTIDAQHAT
ncbi:hypothetical protein MAHJHV65_45120 [Mycobacterium avium subsp. hominissuis]